MILDGVGVGTKTGEIHIEFQLRAEGRYIPAPKIYPSPMQSSWMKIPHSLRDTLRPMGAPTRLRVVVESETDLSMLESFFAEPSVLIKSPMLPESRRSNLQVAREHRSARPQTNPQLDPRVYDPFPGIPVSLGRITHSLPEIKSVSKSSTPAEPSQALAAMELSDGGGSHQNGKGADSDIASVRSSSSAWSFLGKPRENNPAASSPSSSSSSEPLPSLPSPPPPPPPPRRRSKRAPVVVKLESESDSDVQIVKTTQRKPKKSNGASKEGVKTKEKRKKKRRDVVEPITIEADDDNEETEDINEEAEDVNEDDAESERKRKKKKRREKRKSKNLDNDGDIEMESDARSIPPKKKKKKSRRKAPVSDSESPVVTKKTKKKKKGKGKEIQPQSEPDDSPPRKPSESISESRRPTKRKHPDLGSDDDNDDDNEANSEGLSVQRERLKKRINEINMTKHELRVEQEELKAKLLRLDFTTRKLDGANTIRAHCVCSACKKYGHRKNSVVCEMHPDAKRIALWRNLK